MAKRTNNGKGIDIADLIDQPEPTQDEMDFQSFIEDIGPGMSSVDLYRLHKDGRKSYKARLVYADLKENAMEYIRSEYGFGKWILQFRDAGGKIKGNRVIEIEPEHDEKPIAVASSNAPTEMMSYIQQQMAAQQTMILALITSMGQNRGPDMGTLLSGMGSILAAMRQDKPPDLTGLIAALKPADPSAMLANLVTAFTHLKPEDSLDKTAKIIGMAKDLMADKPESTPPDSVWGVAAEVGKHLADRFLPANPNMPGMVYPPQTQPNPQTLQPPVVELRPQPQNQPGNPEEGRQRMLQWIKAGVGYLKEKAKLTKDPLVYVQQILDNQEEPQWQSLLYAIEQGATIADLLQFDPEIAQNPALKTWFETVYKELHDELFNDRDSGGQAGHADHPPVDARTGIDGQPASPDAVPSKPASDS